MRVEAMANDRSRSKSHIILYEYASTILYTFADLLNCMNYYYFDSQNQIPGQAFLWSSLPAEKRAIYS